MSRQSVIVTGGAGFIGSHLANAIADDGAAVVVVDDLSSGRADRVPAEARLAQLDITHRDALIQLFDEVRPSRVFHLGAQASVTRSVADPPRDCEINVQGTLNVLDAAERHRAPVTFASTGGALYGNEAPIPTPESAAPTPLAPYGASKWAGEAYVSTWARASGVPHAVCRLGNVYGPRQSPHGEAGVIAIFAYQLWSGSPPTVFGHGQPTRDYVHVHDVVDAMLRASGRTGTYNVATGIETSVQTVLDLVQDAAGTTMTARYAPLREGELKRSCMDSSRAHRELGWSPRYQLADGVRQTVRALLDEFETDGTHKSS